MRNTVENVWDHRSIVMGLDVDSFGSATFLLKLYPEARIIALYETEYVVQLIAAPADEFARLLKSALWVDQDVLQNVLCVGQHLITGDCKDRLPERNVDSFNPNEFFSQQFAHSFRTDNTMLAIRDDATDCFQSVMRAKCPYSTLMLLLHAFDARWSRNAFVDTLVRHADSVASNILNYKINCEAWRRVLFAPADSQINRLVLETQRIYRNGGECLCAACAAANETAAQKQKALHAHLELMVELERSMPHYFDVRSRKRDRDQCESSKAHQIRKLLLLRNDNANRNNDNGTGKSGVCTHEPISDWLSVLTGGYQGLKLGLEKKFGPEFCKEDFLGDLNAVCQTVAVLAFGVAVPRFETFIHHSVNKARTTRICVIDGATSVFVGANATYLPLHQFIKQAQLFSYAILDGTTIRYTCTGGTLF